MNRQYGTSATIAAILRIAQKVAAQNANLQIGIGDMSFAHGEVMHPHKSHRNGRCIDIRPLRTDGKMLPVTISDDAYDGKRTKSLVQIIRADSNFHSVLFNDSTIAGVTHWEGHDNHLHVTMKA
jgi:murein endopeptidase